MNDPRSHLSPGTYRATVTGVHEGWIDQDTWGITEVEYSLPDCGDWRWAIRARGWGPPISQEFLSGAAERGWFEFIKEDEWRSAATVTGR